MIDFEKLLSIVVEINDQNTTN